MSGGGTSARTRPRVSEEVVFAQCWDDPQVDREAFRAGPEDVVFTITSGGDNALAFLLDDPRRVVALDVHPHQNHLLELKRAAFRGLDHADVLSFLGARESGRRLVHYAQVRRFLPPQSRAWWDTQEEAIAGGVLHAGRAERRLARARTWLRRLLGRSLLEEMAHAADPQARLHLLRRRWTGFRWRLWARVLLSRRTMVRHFGDRRFGHADDDAPSGAQVRGHMEQALERQSARDSSFLSYALLGRYLEPDGLPLYLRPEGFETIRARLDRVETHTGRCLDFFRGLPEGSVSRFSFGNAFEGMPAADFEALLAETVRVARDGSILTYRNLFVPRSRPASLSDRIRPNTALASRLHALDRSFVFHSYVVETVEKTKTPCLA